MKYTKIGKAKIYLGDCMDYMRDLPDNAFELAIVDPPYGLGESNKKFDGRSKLANAGKYERKDWDKEPPQKEYFAQLQRASKNQIVFGANHFIHLIAKGSPCWIVWDKDNGTSDYADCELAYTSFKTAVRKFKWKWQGMLQENMANKEHRIHPTQKPIALYEWLLTNYAKEGDRILDTHLGSGSHAIACNNLGFEMVGIELDEDYYNAAVERITNEARQERLFA